MFTLDANVPKIKATMFAQGSGVVTYIDIWHKCIGHVNVQWLKTMQRQELVIGFPTFRVAKMHKVYEECQFKK